MIDHDGSQLQEILIPAGDAPDPSVAVPTGLGERLAAAAPAERAAVLVAALAVGEPIDLPGAELRGIDLRPGRPERGWDPAGPDLRPTPVVLDGANLTGAILSGACLVGVSLRGARLDGALLVGADLSRADLSGASLRAANLTGARLRRADLSFADLRGAALLTADLSEVTASGADLRDALLQSAMLRRAVLRSADLRWARLTGAQLAGADLRAARFEGAILAMGNFCDALLSPATDFSLAFLYHARFDRTDLTRRHVRGGIGEVHTDLGLARDTYRALARVFESSGQAADARWAHRLAARMATATHRPDLARRYYRSRWPGTSLRQAPFYVQHGSRWLLGQLADLGTGYGTCFARLLATLLLTWLAFAAFFDRAGGIIQHSGAAATWVDSLRYSAASLSPMDAYPLVATSELARFAATLEGVAGMVMLGALGFVAASRMRRE